MDTVGSYPNFEQMKTSPQIGKAGVVIQLQEGPTYKLGESIILNGTYGADAKIQRDSGGQPLTWVLIMVVRRDRPGAWIRAVKDSGNIPPRPREEEKPQQEESPFFLSVGYFNLDLKQFIELPQEAGRYWLLVWFGDFISDRIGFEIKPPEQQKGK